LPKRLDGRPCERFVTTAAGTTDRLKLRIFATQILRPSHSRILWHSLEDQLFFAVKYGVQKLHCTHLWMRGEKVVFRCDLS
jgi:hypothetical protein